MWVQILYAFGRDRNGSDIQAQHESLIVLQIFSMEDSYRVSNDKKVRAR